MASAPRSGGMGSTIDGVPSRILDHCGEPSWREVLIEEVSGPTVVEVRSNWSAHHIRGLTPKRLAATFRESDPAGP